MTNAYRRCSTALWILLAVPALCAAQTTGQASFVPTPCPDRVWEYGDAAFEPLAGAKAFSGKYEGGLYRIEVPDMWNGDLVLWAHGRVDGPTLSVGFPGALRDHLIANGFAWAASSYRCNGSVTGMGAVDTVALRQVFRSVVGDRGPVRRVYGIGNSLGGAAIILALSEIPNAFSGALALCPAAPAETNDYHTALVAAAELIDAVPLGESPSPEALTATMKRFGFAAGGVLTPTGRQYASVQIHLTGGPRPFAVESAQLQRPAPPDEPLRMRIVTNADVVYRIDDGLGLTSAEINKRIRRKAADASLRSARGGPYTELLPLSGKLPAPLLTLHGTGDMQVPMTVQQALRRAAEKRGDAGRLVQRIIRVRGHCGFSAQEQVRAFDDLVTWVQSGVLPPGDDVFGDLRDIGRRFTNPIRDGDPGTLSLTSATEATR